MTGRVFFNAFFGPFKEEMADYAGKGLAILNGQQKLSSGHWKNLKINGQAYLGGNSGKTVFEDILVVNGDINATHCQFDLLDVRGSFKVENCTVTQKGIFYGGGHITSATAKDLILKSPGGTIEILNSTIGNIYFSSLSHMFARLVLDNTTVSGKIIAAKGDGNKIKIINNKSHLTVEEESK